MSKIKRVPTPYSYSEAVSAGDFIFLGLHRGTGDDFVKQLDGTMENLRKTLAEFNLNFPRE